MVEFSRAFAFIKANIKIISDGEKYIFHGLAFPVLMGRGS